MGRQPERRMSGNILLELLLPGRCPICDRILLPKERKRRICVDCAGKLPWIREPRCMKCGKPLKKDTAEYCAACRAGSHRFLKGECTFLYEGDFRESVVRMKFQNRREYLPFYADAMAARHRRFLERVRPALIVPVPMHPRKRRERGFDQCALLGGYLSARTGIRTERGALARTRYTAAQKGLSAGARRENVRNAFAVKEGVRLAEPILLLDDIYTTGSTIDAVTKTLNEAGYRQIYFLALCTGQGDMTAL